MDNAINKKWIESNGGIEKPGEFCAFNLQHPKEHWTLNKDIECGTDTVRLVTCGRQLQFIKMVGEDHGFHLVENYTPPAITEDNPKMASPFTMTKTSINLDITKVALVVSFLLNMILMIYIYRSNRCAVIPLRGHEQEQLMDMNTVTIV